MDRLPIWFRQDMPDQRILNEVRAVFDSGVNTVCSSAKCPNICDCFKRRELTFMILGDRCTRACGFCAVKKSNDPGLYVDPREQEKIVSIISDLGIRYAVITSVTRDDLDDGGAGQFVRVINAIRDFDKDIRIEVLIPDFSGNMSSLESVLDAGPLVLAHNIETVKRLYPLVRPGADYRRSLQILSEAKKLNPAIITKSSLMLGLGEQESEVVEAINDLKENNCDMLTLGQYLSPSKAHYPVQGFISPEQFERYKMLALDSGINSVLSGPLVRSSYRAEEAFESLTKLHSGNVTVERGFDV
jgi:lipoic acid synthetase